MSGSAANVGTMCAFVPRLELVVAIALLLTACNPAPDAAATPAPGNESAPAPAPATEVARAAQSWEPSALDELLAPIALYPDALVGQILAASTNTQEVLDAGNWLLDNQNLGGKELDAATEKLGFNPAVRSLVQFPSVVDMMCSQLEWTREVGQAFSADQEGVLDSIQRLRTQAAAVGNLQSTPQQKVEKQSDGGKEVIVVQPADPKVVYVPQYDPQAVYTTPPPAPATATTTTNSGHSTGDMVAAGLIGFTAGIILNEALDDNDDYYYGPHWGAGAVYVGPRPWTPAHYPYKPVYGPSYRPATGYVRPPNYRHNYNNVDGNVNINIDNDNYYNRVTHNSRAVNRSNTTAAIPETGPNEYRGTRDKAEQRAATSEYKGARDKAEQRAATGEYKGARDKAEQRAATGDYKGARDKTEQRTASSDLKGAHDKAEQRAASVARNNKHQPRADRGFEPAGPAAQAHNKPASSPHANKSASSSGALSNVSRGKKEHAASQRGHQSAGNHARKPR